MTVFAPKGGAGKTVLASNLAVVFARKQGGARCCSTSISSSATPPS